MAFKIDIAETIVPLVVVGGIGYFAIVYGPQLMATVNQVIQTGLTAGLPPPPVSGATDATTTPPTSTTGDPQLDALLRSMGIDPATMMGAGGQGAVNQGLPSPFGSALQNTGGVPGVLPGTVPPNYNTALGYPQYTGAPQYLSTPLGSPQITCTGGVCRSNVAMQINGGG